MESNHPFEHKLKIARSFEAEGKYLHALQLYHRIINEYPDYAEPYYSIAEIYEHIGKIEPAISVIKSFLADNPENKDMRLFLGQYLLRNSRWEEAIEFLEYLLPEEEPVAVFFLGYSYFMLNDYERARLCFLKFINLEKQTELVHEAHIYLAKIDIQLNDFESALTFAQKANVIYSNFWELNHIFAITYFNLGMLAHAVQSVEKAIKLNPEEPAPYELAGKIYFKLGDYLKAEERFLKYIGLIENAGADVYTRLAETCIKRKKLKDALAYFDVAVKLDPENHHAVEGRQNVAAVLNSTNDH